MFEELRTTNQNSEIGGTGELLLLPCLAEGFLLGTEIFSQNRCEQRASPVFS